jgi:hypothetical protein
MAYAAETFLTPELMGNGVKGSDIAVSINKFTILTAWGTMILNILIFGSLSIYLDQVIPGEFGKT